MKKKRNKETEKRKVGSDREKIQIMYSSKKISVLYLRSPDHRSFTVLLLYS